MRAFVLLVFVLLSWALVSCGSAEDRNPYAIAVELWVGFPAASQEVELRWVDGHQSPSDQPSMQGGSTSTLSIQRTFATAEEARSFGGEVVVLVGGREADHETVRFDACDAASELGVDSLAISLTTIHRSVLRTQLSTDNQRWPLGCYFSRSSYRPNKDRDIRRATYFLPIEEGIATFKLDGRAFDPVAVQPGGDQRIYTIHVEVPATSQSEDLAELEVLLDDVSRGTVHVSFEECTEWETLDELAEQELWLELSGNVDYFYRITCRHYDGGESTIFYD